MTLGDNKLERVSKLCVGISCVMLAFAGGFKVISAFGEARILFEIDPVFGITNQSLFLLVGALELWAVVALIRSRSVPLKVVLLASLTTNFLFYRAGLWWLGVKQPCPCLGNAGAWTHANPKVLDAIITVGLVWLTLSSYLPLLWLWRQGKGKTLGTPNRPETSDLSRESVIAGTAL